MYIQDIRNRFIFLLIVLIRKFLHRNSINKWSSISFNIKFYNMRLFYKIFNEFYKKKKNKWKNKICMVFSINFIPLLGRIS